MRTGASVYLRADGRWEARYQKGRDENGKIIYGYSYGATQDEAERKRAEAIRAVRPDSDTDGSMLASRNPNLSTQVIHKKSTGKGKYKNRYEKLVEPLSDADVLRLDEACWKSSDPAAIAFYLSLHMGLILSECAALRFCDLDVRTQTVHVRNELRVRRSLTLEQASVVRDVPMPQTVVDFLRAKDLNRYSPDCYVFQNSERLPESTAAIKWAFRKMVPELAAMDPTALRCTFLKKCLDADLNVESIAAITGVERSELYKWYGKYIRANVNAIHRVEIGEVRTNEADARSGIERQKQPSRQLNLLILGAGSHGHAVQEIAEKLGIFGRIRFLDDAVVGDDILDTCDNSQKYLAEYPCAFVAIGKNERRFALAEQLRAEGFMLPHIIHPNATVSKNAVIGDGTIVMAQATVNASTVGALCIVASNALVNFGATVGDYSHIDCGGMVMKDAMVPPMTFIAGGEIFDH